MPKYKPPVKCKFCGETFIRELTDYVVINSKRFAHKACYDKAVAEMTEEQRCEFQLTNYIKSIFKIDAIPQSVHFQLQNFRNKGYTNKGMLKALQYWFDVKHNKPTSNITVGIIPYIYEDAHNYFKNLLIINEKNEAKPIVQEEEKVWEVHIPPPKRQPKIKF